MAAAAPEPDPTNPDECELLLVGLLKTARATWLSDQAVCDDLDDAAFNRQHRRRRAMVPAAARGSSHGLQPSRFAHRSMVQRGRQWSDVLVPEQRARLLRLLEPMLQEQRSTQGLDCACCCYTKVLGQSDQSGIFAKTGSAGFGLSLGFCLCKEQAEARRRGPEAGVAVAELFSQIDTDGGGTLDRAEVAALKRGTAIAPPF